jgi:cysteine-rich repeat protein
VKRRLLTLLLAGACAACAETGVDILGFCGDGDIVAEIDEQCDDGNNIDGDGCTFDCQLEIPPACGDGTLDPGEECDDGNVMGGDGCDANCNLEGIQPTLASIQENVFTPICTECHVPGGPGPFSLESESVSFANLVDVPSFEVFGLDRVEPGDPENSYIVHKIEDRMGIIGQRMPPPPRPILTQEQIDAIREWIQDGAQP